MQKFLKAIGLTRIDHNEGLVEPPLHCFASLTNEELERFPMSPPLIAKETNLRQRLLKSHKDSKVGQKKIEDIQLSTVSDKVPIPLAHMYLTNTSCESFRSISQCVGWLLGRVLLT